MATTGLRAAPYVSTKRSLDERTLPWRLYQKSKQTFWDPAEIDFTRDAEDWAGLDRIERKTLARLATVFMVGEESVTVDILPLVRAMADTGRLEDTLFLTAFAFEEGKHTELFRRWFDAVDFDEPLEDMLGPAYRQLFEEEEPRAMQRLDTDRSPEAFLDAVVTYNLFAEGVMALTGYRAWGEIFEDRGILPGMQEGLVGIQRDERRHVAYGTHVARRIVSEHPHLWEFVQGRMGELQELGIGLINELGDDLVQEASSEGGAEIYLSGQTPEEVLQEYGSYALTQVSRRLEVIEAACRESISDVEASNLASDVEDELASA